MNKDYYNKFYISKSKIHGVGVFSRKELNKNTIIGIAMTNINPFNFIFIPDITQDLGKFINHSYKPNAYLYYNKNKNSFLRFFYC